MAGVPPSILPVLGIKPGALHTYKTPRPGYLPQQPIIIRKSEADKLKIFYSIRGRTASKLDKGFYRGRNHCSRRHIFAPAVIVEGLSGFIKIKLTGTIQQFKGILNGKFL